MPQTVQQFWRQGNMNIRICHARITSREVQGAEQVNLRGHQFWKNP
jgi:hypothetical protein